MKKSDIEYLIVEIAEKIYSENNDKIKDLKDIRNIIDFTRFECEQILTEVLYALIQMMG